MNILKALENYRVDVRYLAKRPGDQQPMFFTSYAAALAYLKDHDPPSPIWSIEEEIVKALAGRFPADIHDEIKIDIPGMTFYDLITLAEVVKNYFDRMREIGFHRKT